MPRKPDLRLRRHQEAGTEAHSHVGHMLLHSWPGPARWPRLCPGWAGPPSRGPEPLSTRSTVVFHCGPYSRNSCFILNPCPFQLVKPFIWPLQPGLPATALSFLICPWPHLGRSRGSTQQRAEIRSPGVDSSRVSGASRTPGPGLFLCSAPSSAHLLLPWVQVPLGHSEDNNVLKQVYLGSARSLLFLGGSLPSGFAPHWEAPEMPLALSFLIILPLPPSPAFTASGTSSSNTARIVRAPRPPDSKVPASVAFGASCCSSEWNAFPLAPPALSAWQTPQSSHQSPQGPLSQEVPLLLPCPSLSRLPLLLSMLLLWHLSHCILLVYTFVSPFNCEPFRAWTVSYVSLYFRA